MKWGLVIVSIFIAIIMFLYQWPKLKKQQKKEKAAFLSLTCLGLLLAVLLILYPEMPGPTQLIDWIYKPFGKLIEK
ncbi:hypothetical protein [Neobacillus sp. SAB-20_R2A]|uniref:hypothetical protein n=1 Tax=Neobacillus sp. SAB-20_R2A TaxID=3120519 RepID=UPI003C6E4BCE